MIRITLNGKPFNKGSLEGAMVEALVGHLREKLGSIRHPETGEFPTIAVTGTDLSSLTCHVEGTPELLAMVRARFAQGDDDAPGTATLEGAEDAVEEKPGRPKAFLSYAFEDSELARGIAEALMAQGIDTWWAQWCITSGDSIRQRIDEGIGECTHFIVLLTPQSITKPWVNLEIDAGLVRRLSGQTKLIPLRCGLEPSELTPLLQTFFSPTVDPTVLDVTQLINDIHGLTRKPELGPPPTAATAGTMAGAEYSPAAMALAKHFIEKSVSGMQFDPQAEPDALVAELGISDEDLSDAIFELKGLVTDRLGHIVYPEEALFAKLDKYWMPWDPAEDALRIAAGLVNDESFPDKPAEMAQVFGWSARRLNPALAYLCMRGLVRDVRAFDGGGFLAYRIDKTDATRRFVKSRK